MVCDIEFVLFSEINLILYFFFVAAAMTADSPFLASETHSPSYSAKLKSLYCQGVRCDALAMSYAFQKWIAAKKSLRGRAAAMRWCQDHLLDIARLKEVI